MDTISISYLFLRRSILAIRFCSSPLKTKKNIIKLLLIVCQGESLSHFLINGNRALSYHLMVCLSDSLHLIWAFNISL